ncbi:MAG: DUF5107 domain-containing protein [Bacteroidales bacterium]|nr:DUF5107 domain-containing protein [Bacteroidales bacterium]
MQRTCISETVVAMNTYPYGDPDPVPSCGKIHPYFRYDSYSMEPELREWKTIVLENEFLKVKILPECGGKVWSVYDKVGKNEMFYDNDVVKFRDIAMRGPWTSGGIEFNFGIIGHAPTCSSPVDYRTITKEDGSSSCYIGVLDLITRTRWTIEICLPASKDYLVTRTFWHNGTGNFQPYYTWSNTGVTASEDLKLIYPAAYTIGHSGEVSDYPYDISMGRDLSEYSQLDYGPAKSFHPGGSHKGYFGAWWRDSDKGMLHLADRDQKLGRKFFSWAKSDEGIIWKELLTDTKPQYVELQSGRLFNQNDAGSMHTPFKQFLFSPYGTDEWSEIWLPYSGIGEPGDVTENGVANVVIKEDSLLLRYYPLADLAGELRIVDNKGIILASEQVEFKAAEVYSNEFALASGGVPSKIVAGSKKIWSSDPELLDRPSVIPEAYDESTALGQYLLGKNCAGMRLLKDAETHADMALELNPDFIPALNLKAYTLLQKADWQSSLDYTLKALAIDTYDAEANFLSGQAETALGRITDAMDRYEIAAITSEYRSAAYTALSRLHFKEGDYEAALKYASRSLVGNAYNITGLELKYLASRDKSILEHIRMQDPLCHFPDFADYLDGVISADELYGSMFEEMKWQEYMETAVFFHGLGLDTEAARILSACPDKNVLTELWKAFLEVRTDAIPEAEKANVDFVFPFRTESLEPLQWSAGNGGGWMSCYLLSILHKYLGNMEKAKEYAAITDSDYAPLYAYRYDLCGDMNDLKKAIELDPEQWRYRTRLITRYMDSGEKELALKEVSSFYPDHKDNSHVADLLVRALAMNGMYDKAEKVLAGMTIMPFEGMTGGRRLYEEVKLHLAARAIDAGKYVKAKKYVAEAREWPHNLGSGKPYDELIDNSLEDWLDEVIAERSSSGGRQNKTSVSDELDRRIVSFQDKRMF